MVSEGSNSKQRPPGRPLLPQAFVDERKRERCARALAEEAREAGVQDVTVTTITTRARISRATFYSLFKGLEEALLYAYRLGGRQLMKPIEEAAAGTGAWEARVGAAIAGMFEVARVEPHVVELCLVRPCDEGLIAALAGLLAEGRGGPPPGRSGPGPRAERLLAHGILAIVAQRLRRGESDSLPGLAGSLTDFATVRFRAPSPPSGARPNGRRSTANSGPREVF